MSGDRQPTCAWVWGTAILLAAGACSDDPGEPADAADERYDGILEDGSDDGDEPLDDGTGEGEDVGFEEGGGDDGGPPEDIRTLLGRVPGLDVIDAGGAGSVRFFDLRYDQPVDHAEPGRATFGQAMTLTFVSTEASTVLMTEGYANMWGFERAELALLLDANQLVVEHRFFGASRPEPPDWTKLDIEQAAGDHHRIVEALRPILTGPWVSTGYSKGGMTAVYHRRFHPDDVVGTVAYVAPISFGAPDARYLDFVDAAGEPDCRARLAAVQREALVRGDALRARLDPWSFARLGGVERAFESVVLEVPFTFWQYAGYTYCGTVPVVPGASDDALFSFIDRIVGFDSAGDAEMDWFAPYYYQAWEQLGFPDVDHTSLADLLRTGAPSLEEGVLPAGAPVPAYDPAAMIGVARWVAEDGARLIFVYGQWDPWTAGAFDVGAAVDSYRFVAAGGTHSSQLADLAAADQAVAHDALERWTGVHVRSLPKSAVPPPRLPRHPVF
ncbi:MAG: aminopeptidase [Deltaproteobacteria bacterium]|nr:aminopeptidase [Deltaproteobacteria bacterium]